MGVCIDTSCGIICEHYSSSPQGTHIKTYCNKYKKVLIGMTMIRSYVPHGIQKTESKCPIKEFPDEIIINV